MLVSFFRVRPLCFLALFGLCFIPYYSSAQASFKTTASVNLRSGPGTKFEILTSIPNNTTVTAVDTSKSTWTKVEYNGIKGYVGRKFLELVPPKIIVTPKKEEPKPTVPEKTDIGSVIAGFFSIACLTLLVVLIIRRANRSSQSKKPPQKITSYSQRSKPQQNVSSNNRSIPKIKVEIVTSGSSIPNKTATSVKPQVSQDKSIEDVTGKAQPIQYTNTSTVTDPNAVPYWRQEYIYSTRALSGASAEQKAFYIRFKDEFLKTQWLNIEGNSNYAFILLFDLLDDYKKHKQLDLLENQYRFLWKNWPKTESYARNMLIQEMSTVGDMTGIVRLNAEIRSTYSGFGFQEPYWGLGNRYKKKLKLNDNQVKVLNDLIDTSNSFNSIEYCAKHLVFSFFFVIDEISKQFAAKTTTFDEQSRIIGEIEIAKHYKFRAGSNNYRAQLSEFPRTVRQAIYKTCENSLRDFLFVGRKTDLSYYIHSTEADEKFKEIFSPSVLSLLEKYHSEMEQPDESTEIELNQYGKGRWKDKLEILKEHFTEERSESFFESILKLGKENKSNPSVENIFLDASKFVAKVDALTSLKLYTYYIYYDLLSVTFDNRQLTKTIQKTLFQNPEQVKDFQEIINELIGDKDVSKALLKLPEIYKTKRKKIKIDTSKVKEVQEQHAETVDLLNEYLQDEESNEQSGIKTEEVKITVDVPEESVQKSAFKAELNLTASQCAALTLFFKRGFSCSYEEIDTFARENGAFRSSLIEGINENCYSIFDDILIEDEDGSYQVNESYYQQILST